LNSSRSVVSSPNSFFDSSCSSVHHGVVEQQMVDEGYAE
jgi:hypothetical protein